MFSPAVDPPDDLVISDLGHFGRLQISWSPPAGQINETECSHLYQLEYFNSYSDSWSVSAHHFIKILWNHILNKETITCTGV